MPHKTQRTEGDKKTSNLAPGRASLKNEAIPKSAARVLNAQKVRDDYRKKRKLEDRQGRNERSNKWRKQETSQKGGKVSLLIQPEESLQHFNKRVEDDLRPLVKSAMQTARAIERNAARQEREARAAPSKNKNMTRKIIDDTNEVKSTRDKDAAPSPSPSPKEFATALPKSLNNVAQAPPEFKKLPRGVSSFSSKKGDVLSMSQILLMEKERERVIQRYRELRTSQRLAKAEA